MTGPMHYDDLAQLGHQRQATLQREAQRWRLARQAHARARAKGRPPGGAWRWIRHTLAGALWGPARPGAGRPAAA
jgi:hypothetical protein